MLGGSQGISGCQLRNARAEKTAIEASYDCGNPELTPATLRHRSTAPSGAILTKRFALSSSSPQASRAFLDTVATRVAAREGEFMWVPATAAPLASAAGRAGSEVATPGAPAGSRTFWRWLAITLASLIAIIAAWRTGGAAPVPASEDRP
jgi:hypothetical protein